MLHWPILCVACFVLIAGLSHASRSPHQGRENKKPLIEEFHRSSREAVANASLADFMHAWGMVTSRALPVPTGRSHSPAGKEGEGEGEGGEGAGKGEGDGEGEDYVLLPFADLLNHGDPANVAYKARGARRIMMG